MDQPITMTSLIQAKKQSS